MKSITRTLAENVERAVPIVRSVLVRGWLILPFLACAACVATGGAPRY